MDEIITLDYGSGGKKTSALIESRIVPLMQNEVLNQLGDGAVMKGADQLVFSTDSFVVSPVFFPGGDIGKLSVCGTVNDISMAGGDAKYLSLSLILEEGFPMADLDRILQSIADTAKSAGVQIVTGDTKVVEKGQGDGIYINTSGIGFLHTANLSVDRIEPSDVVIVSGTVGDHGTAVMLARNQNLVQGEIRTDCACLKDMALALGDLGDDLKIMRDPTRGGLATTLCEFTEGRSICIELQEDAVPVREEVSSACEMLGLDPLYCANEGKLIAIVSKEKADEALRILRSYSEGAAAAVIGTVTQQRKGKVLLRTSFGGCRILSKLSGSQLPRIC